MKLKIMERSVVYDVLQTALLPDQMVWMLKESASSTRITRSLPLTPGNGYVYVYNAPVIGGKVLFFFSDIDR